MRGELMIRTFRREDLDRGVCRPEKRLVLPNVTTNSIKTQICHLIVGHEANLRYINRMVFGVGGHEEGNPLVPIPPQPTDTQLESPIISKPIASFEFPSPASVKIVAFLTETEGNGFTFTEAGLITANNILVARRTFGGMTKSNDFVFEFTWTLFM